MAFSG